MRVSPVAACALAMALLPDATAAQVAPRLFTPWTAAGASNAIPPDGDARAIAGPTLLSLALPGAGQHVLGQRRKWAYLALEALGWTVYVERRRAGSDLQGRYRDFAWSTGRIQGATRVDGDFEYYERLTQWMASGAFDSDPAVVGVQPEADPATYNGSIWSLASQIFLPPGGGVPATDPRYQDALGFYAERAYGTELLWDWTGSPGAQQELATLIERSDDRFRQATTALGAVIANHLLSAVDAYLSARGRRSPVSLRLLPGDGHGLPVASRWSAVARVPVGS